MIVTGDPSADQHAANVLKTLFQLTEPHGIAPEVFAVGGHYLSHMPNVTVIEDHAKLGKVGLDGFLGSLWNHISLGLKLLRWIENEQPDMILLIDYGGFNLRLAKAIRRRYKQLPIFYFIPPQVWASRPGRIKKMQGVISHVFCIFPFETQHYQKADIPASYVGHPLAGQLPKAPTDEQKRAFLHHWGLDPTRPVMAVLPGSRRSEVRQFLPTMIKAANLFTQRRIQEYQPIPQWVVSKANSIPEKEFDKLLESLTKRYPEVDITVLPGGADTRRLMCLAHAGIVKSGTATLEAALLGTPSVIVYKSNWLVAKIARYLIRTPFFGLPNLLHLHLTHPDLDWFSVRLGISENERLTPIFPELLQENFTPLNVCEALEQLMWPNHVVRERAVTGMQQLQHAFLNTPPATEQLAQLLALRLAGEATG